jgi:DeoR family fructose operon transcriptional repressor
MSGENLPGLLSTERRNQLLSILRSENKIDVTQAAARLEASSETIRRDLMALESQGLLRRVHGGALPIQSVTFEPSLQQRNQNMAEKARIAAMALSYLPAEGAIFIDSGSTTNYFAELIPPTAQVSIFTNAINIAQTVSTKPDLHCHLLGGRVRYASTSGVGPWAMRALSELRIDVAFVGANAVSFERGLTTPDIDESEVKGAVLRHAARNILMVDHTKFNVEAMIAYAKIKDVHLIITGKELEKDLRTKLEKFGVEVVYA